MENLTLDFNNFGSRAALGTYEKCDSLTLTIVLDEKDYTGYKFKIVAKKSDGHIIEQDIKEQDINREEKIIKTELNNQFTTKEGVVKLEINMIKDGKEDTTKEAFFIVRDTINGEVVESTSIIPTLEGVKAFIDEAVISLGDLEQAGEDITIINSEFKENEIKRKANEMLREKNEKARLQSEDIRITEEEERVANELERIKAENNRKVSESNRKVSENTRVTNERAREEAELSRQSTFEENEEIRNSNENLRIESEKERIKFNNKAKTDEVNRKEAETKRVEAEKTRVIAEDERKKAETSRQEAEDIRQNTYTNFNEAEEERRNNEISRQEAEALRIEAEKRRDDLYSQKEEERNAAFLESERTRGTAFNEAQNDRNLTFEESEAIREEAFKVSEVARNEAEEGRVAAELLRVEAEKLRVAGEENRNATFTQSEEERKATFEEAENARKVAESKRVKAESSRVEAEKLRVIAETERVEAENLRVTAEEGRVEAETRREEGFNKFEGKINANTEELKKARSATSGEEFNSLDERIDCEVDRLNKKIEVSMLQQEDKERHIIENTVEGVTSDMVVKGRTLQNLCSSKLVTINVGQVFSNTISPLNLLQGGKTYTIIYNLTKTSSINERCTPYLQNASGTRIYEKATANYNISTGIKKWTITLSSDFDPTQLCFWVQGHNSDVEIKDFIIIEGDYTNKPIPAYFEGINSFGQQEDKISILSRTSNLFNKNTTKNYVDETGETFNQEYISSDFIEVKENINYIRSDTKTRGNIAYDKDKRVIGNITTGNTILTPKNCRYIRFNIHNSVNVNTVIFAEGNILPLYQPYQLDKKDILLSQYGFDEGLRGFNSTVCDELNDIRRVVVKTVEKYISKGNETITVHTVRNDTISFNYIFNGGTPKGKNSNPNFIANCFVTNLACYSNDVEGCFGTPNGFYGSISKAKLESPDIEGITKYIRENFKECYFELAKPVETPLDENINLKTFGEKTYISFENAISGTSSFKAPVNAAATISRLNRENRALEEENAKLKAETYKNAEDIIITNEELQITQSAVDHLLFSNLNASGTAMLYNGKKKGGGSMGAYLAMRIIKGKLKYDAVMKQYGEFKEDIDLILEAEGYGHLITQQ
ncbi:hypothetical protein [Clostridium perfringens]|uniref:hypothetical protein n=1 Tax=Clostridium perfringens TaxID=1502 RepID=UPI0018E4C650|nr:hypothetical protein [Clostridium perfringens]MBI6050347.1 hypothetical protein [Clostridium perfringens]